MKIFIPEDVLTNDMNNYEMLAYCYLRALTYSKESHYYCISDYIVYIEDGRKVFRYYITPLGRQFVIKIFENLTAEQRQKLKKD